MPPAEARAVRSAAGVAEAEQAAGEAEGPAARSAAGVA